MVIRQMRDEAKKQGLPNWQYNSVSRVGLKNSLSLSKDEVRKKGKTIFEESLSTNETSRFNISFTHFYYFLQSLCSRDDPQSDALLSQQC